MEYISFHFKFLLFYSLFTFLHNHTIIHLPQNKLKNSNFEYKKIERLIIMRKNVYFYETNTPIGKIGLATTENDSHITDVIWNYEIEKFKNDDNFQIIETELIKRAKKQLFEYFSKKRKQFDLPLLKEGTPFQISVWNALETIPYGETRSYKDIAVAIKNEKAVRAVGMANNRNKISIFIPCHRVIGANGKLVGYGGGLHIKKFLLELEGIKIK